MNGDPLASQPSTTGASCLTPIELSAFLRCPLCKGPVASRGEAYHCARCDRAYPVVLGIPDFRVYPDPYISIEADHRKGAQVQEQAEKLSFRDLLRFYWEHVATPPTPLDLRERFIRHVLTDEIGRAHV